MPTVDLPDVTLAYDVTGEGEPVLLVCGTGQPAVTWHLGMVGALVEAGFSAVTFDNRGMEPSSSPPPPYTVFDLVADAAGLIEHLGIGPCRVVGYSLGAMTAQELALARPDLVERAVMLGTVGRNNVMFRTWARARLELEEAGIVLPGRYQAVATVMEMMGPAHKLDDDFVGPWLEVLTEAPPWTGDGPKGQYAADLAYPDRLEALAGVTVPCLVVGFEYDMVTPAPMCREVVGAIPGCRYAEVPGCGHLGPLEDTPAVAAVVVDFLKDG